MHCKKNLLLIFLALISGQIYADSTREVKAYCKFGSMPQPLPKGTIEVKELNVAGKPNYVTSQEIFSILLKGCIGLTEKEDGKGIDAIPVDILVHVTNPREEENVVFHSLNFVVVTGKDVKFVTLADALSAQAKSLLNIQMKSQYEDSFDSDSTPDEEWVMIGDEDLKGYDADDLQNEGFLTSLDPKLKTALAVAGAGAICVIGYVYLPTITSIAAEKLAPYLFEAMYGTSPSQLSIIRYYAVYEPFKRHLMGQAYIHAHVIGSAAFTAGSTIGNVGYIGSKKAFVKASSFWTNQQKTPVTVY